MSPNEDTIFNTEVKNKKHDIPLDHLDYKYVEKCDNIKELEKIFKVLTSGVEGKYPDLENFVFEKIKRLNPNSRVLRKDAPILSKYSIPKSEQKDLDKEIEDFVNSVPNVEKKFSNTETKQNDPPIRGLNQQIHLASTKDSKNIVNEKPSSDKKTSNKSVKPKDYREWAKIEKTLENELEESNSSETTTTKVNKTVINQPANATSANTKKLIENLKKEEIKVEEDLDDNIKEIRAEQEKCKGNESYNAGCYDEALVYYTRSIKYFPNLASYNNRAMTYLKLENWDKVIEDCDVVLKDDKENVKALLRRATANNQKRKYNNALNDIILCLKLEPNNKKAQDLKISIEKSIAKEKEEIERVKSIGGNRLKIEDTDGSSDEEEDPYEGTKVSNATTLINTEKKKIKIAEVESEDFDDDEEEVVKKDEVKNEQEEKANVEQAVKQEEKKQTEQTVKKNYQLTKNVIDLKDKANKYFSEGQYGDALEIFTQTIAIISDLIKQNEKLNEEINAFYSNNLIVLYNNRAKCYQSIGDFKTCIKDCDLALALIERYQLLADNDAEQAAQFKSLKMKLIWKKAYSLEMLEKYADAFLQYESLMKYDSKYQNVQLNYNRVRNILNQNGQLNKIRRIESDKKIEPRIAESDKEKNEREYEENKVKGNDYFKKNDFLSACEFYSKCIELDKENPLAYLNRSLCYIKLNKNDLAIKDTTFVLEKDPTNVKGLYRRALANKAKKMYDLVIEDLNKLISVEPNNQIAINDIKVVRELKDKENVSKSQEAKVLSSKITEVKIDEINKEKPKEVIKVKETKEAFKPAPPCLTENYTKTRLETMFSNITNGYEFLQAWNSIKPNDLELFVHLLSNVNPAKLALFVGTKLDDDMIKKLIISLHKLSFEADYSKLLTKDKNDYKIIDYLVQMTKIQRFDIIKLFLNKEQKEQVKQIIASIQHEDRAKVDAVKKSFGV